MPNHCFNEVKAKKEILDEIYDYEKGKITFNKLIPMPKELEDSVSDGSTTIKKAMYLYLNGDKDLLEAKWEANKDAQQKYKTFDKMVEHLFEKYPKEEVIRSYTCLQKYGTDNWYDWSIEHWGTKWDAYDCQGSPQEGTLIFFTAWNPPDEIIKALCKKYPNSDLDWFYEEEGMQFAGHCYAGENGEVINKECAVSNYEAEEDDMEF